jgi:hypothetical protein
MKFLIFPLVFCLCSCAGSNYSKDSHTNNRTGSAIDVAIAVLNSKDVSSKCEQGHAQDRINCRNKKKEQVDTLNNLIKKHTNK